MLARAREKFDENMKLTDAQSGETLGNLINNLLNWSRKLA